MTTTQTNLKTVNGHISYTDSGKGEKVIVAAPGMGDVKEVYRHLSPLLEKDGYRFISMDLRGLGDSSTDHDDYSDKAIADDYIALAKELKLKDVILVGNSKTASSVVLAAVSNPEMVSGVVMLGPFARVVPAKWWQMLLFVAMLGGPWGRSAWVSYYKKQLYPENKPQDLDEYVKRLSKNLSEKGRMKAFRKLTMDKHADSDAQLENVTQPTLIVMGDKDPDFPDAVEEAKLLGSRIKNSTVVISEGSGHYPQADNPEFVAKHIKEMVL